MSNEDLIAKSREIIASQGSLTGPSVERLCVALEAAEREKQAITDNALDIAVSCNEAWKRAEAAEGERDRLRDLLADLKEASDPHDYEYLHEAAFVLKGINLAIRKEPALTPEQPDKEVDQ